MTTGKAVFNRLPVDDVDVVIPVSAVTGGAVSSPPIIGTKCLLKKGQWNVEN